MLVMQSCRHGASNTAALGSVLVPVSSLLECKVFASEAGNDWGPYYLQDPCTLHACHQVGAAWATALMHSAESGLLKWSFAQEALHVEHLPTQPDRAWIYTCPDSCHMLRVILCSLTWDEQDSRLVAQIWAGHCLSV